MCETEAASSCERFLHVTSFSVTSPKALHDSHYSSHNSSSSYFFSSFSFLLLTSSFLLLFLSYFAFILLLSSLNIFSSLLSPVIFSQSLRTMSMNELMYVDDNIKIMRNCGALRIYFIYERIN